MADQIKVGDSAELQNLFPDLDYNSSWETPESFARHIEAIKEKDAWNDAAWERGAGFSGTENMQAALELAKNGWKEGIQRIEKARSGILAAHPMLVKAVRYDIAGSVANVPRAISGNPLNMKANDLSKSRRRPVITLISNMSANCGVDKAAITNRAAVVAAIIDQIETMGYACEVISIAPTAGGKGFFGDGGKEGFKACTSIIVKASNQPVDIGRLSFGLGHASMFRRLVFADWCGHSSLQSGIGRGLGRPLKLNLEPADKDKGYYLLSSAEGNAGLFESEERAATIGLKFLIDELVKQGCPAFAGLPTLLEKAA